MAKERETNLGKYLRSALEGVDQKSALPVFEDFFTSSSYPELLEFYKSLGGLLSDIPVGIKSNHIDLFINGNILELDEENHFNRYRFKSLEMPIYSTSNILNKENYAHFCAQYEGKARNYGKFWTNTSCEKMFGKPSLNGDLSGNGSPRWKQRAFYDTLKDHFSLVSDIKVKRISIYDSIEINGQKKSVNDLLKTYNPAYTQGILSAIKF